MEIIPILMKIVMLNLGGKEGMFQIKEIINCMCIYTHTYLCIYLSIWLDVLLYKLQQ